MICPECGAKLNKEDKICLECGYQFEKISNVKVKDERKKINKIFLIILLIIIVIGGLFYLLNNNKKKVSLNVVSDFCDGEYINDVIISDVIDNYSCEKFVSYMIDTNGVDLQDYHYKTLMEFEDKKIYKIIKFFKGSELINIYQDKIYDENYYDYLIENNIFDEVEEDYYHAVFDYAFKQKDFPLFKTLLKGNETLTYKHNWKNEKYYYSATSDMDYEKELTERREFALEYFKYNDANVICFFDKELFKYVYNKKNAIDNYLYRELVENLHLVSLDKLKEIHSYGFVFYQEGTYFLDNIFEYYILKLNAKSNDSEYLKKIDYIFKEAIKEGYDISYSDYLDRYVYYFNSQRDIQKNIYK